jgi:hypothetical protein
MFRRMTERQALAIVVALSAARAYVARSHVPLRTRKVLAGIGLAATVRTLLRRS